MENLLKKNKCSKTGWKYFTLFSVVKTGSQISRIPPKIKV